MTDRKPSDEDQLRKIRSDLKKALADLDAADASSVTPHVDLALHRLNELIMARRSPPE